MVDSVQEQLIQLLERSSQEHHEYEQAVLNGVRDEEWDLWYASWLVEHGINDLLNSDMDSPTLATLLTEINNQHQQSDQRRSWAAYTALQLIETAG